MTEMSLSEAREILGVSADANSKEIKSRFRTLAIEHHPDHGGDSEKFKLIAKAYSTIINWGGTDIVARKVEEAIFESMWDEWLQTLSQEEQDEVSKRLRRNTRSKR